MLIISPLQINLRMHRLTKCLMIHIILLVKPCFLQIPSIHKTAQIVISKNKLSSLSKGGTCYAEFGVCLENLLEFG